MKLSNILNEAPLPDDWDGGIYNDKIPFSRRIKYAQERAAKIGSGSSRVAFEIPYQGRPTILKIAKNAKGAAQNEYEAQMLRDWHLKSYEITIPMIDYDESSEYPTWIHMEKASKAKPSDFKRLAGATQQQIVEAAMFYSGQAYKDLRYKGLKEEDLKVDDENEVVRGLVELFGNYHMPHGDMTMLANWGVYNGKLVIIDLGLSQDVWDTHYSRR